MPQLNVSTYVGQLFWLFFSFTLLYGAMAYFIVPKLDKIFRKRKVKIRNLLEEAERLQAEARDLVLLNQKKLQEARDEAQGKIQDILNSMQERKEKQKQEMEVYFQKQLKLAEEKLQTLKGQAFQEAEFLKGELVTAIFQKILEKGFVFDQELPSPSPGEMG